MASLNFDLEHRVFKDWYSENFPKLRTAEKSFRNLVQLLLSQDQSFTKPKVISRVKDRDECVKKFQRKYQEDLEKSQTEYTISEHISDVIGLRVICLYESDVEEIVRVLKEHFYVIDLTDKTAQHNENETFGYKGIHLDLKINGQRKNLPEYQNILQFSFEIQIRTIVQDAWSEIDHKLKYKKSLPKDVARRIFVLASLFELADREFDQIRMKTDNLIDNIKIDDPDSNYLNDFVSGFGFLRIMNSIREYTNYQFDSERVDGFVQELLKRNPTLTNGELKGFIDTHFTLVHSYRQERYDTLGINLNPFTEIRHVLQLEDPEQYAGILFDKQRDSFYEWLDKDCEQQESKDIDDTSTTYSTEEFVS